MPGDKAVKIGKVVIGQVLVVPTKIKGYNRSQINRKSGGKAVARTPTIKNCFPTGMAPIRNAITHNNKNYAKGTTLMSPIQEMTAHKI
jgi:hypothetical protein